MKLRKRRMNTDEDGGMGMEYGEGTRLYMSPRCLLVCWLVLSSVHPSVDPSVFRTFYA